MTYKEDLVTREVHSVLRRVEEWVNDPYLREVRGVPIGVGLREADREQALAWVLKTLDAHTRRRARLERLADKGRRSWEPPRTTSALLANPIGEIAKRAHERSAPLKGLDGRKYVERLYGSPKSDSLAVSEARERLRGGRAGKLITATIWVVPGARPAFQAAHGGRNRWIPTPDLQSALDRQLIGVSRSEPAAPQFPPRGPDQQIRLSPGWDPPGESDPRRPPQGWQSREPAPRIGGVEVPHRDPLQEALDMPNGPDFETDKRPNTAQVEADERRRAKGLQVPGPPIPPEAPKSTVTNRPWEVDPDEPGG